MAKVKPTEKTLEQFFSEKLAAIHKEDKHVIKTRKTGPANSISRI